MRLRCDTFLDRCRLLLFWTLLFFLFTIPKKTIMRKIFNICKKLFSSFFCRINQQTFRQARKTNFDDNEYDDDVSVVVK